MTSTQIPETETADDEDAAALYAAASDAGDSDPSARQLLLFAAGGRLYGCELVTVREIIPFRRCTRLPGSPSYVCGLTNLRGTVVTVIDLAARLGAARSVEGGAPTAVERTQGSIIVAEYGTKVVGLAVDGVRDVQVMRDDALEAPTTTAPLAASGDGAVVQGLGQLGDEVVIVLDVQTILRQVLA